MRFVNSVTLYLNKPKRLTDKLLENKKIQPSGRNSRDKDFKYITDR